MMKIFKRRLDITTSAFRIFRYHPFDRHEEILFLYPHTPKNPEFYFNYRLLFLQLNTNLSIVQPTRSMLPLSLAEQAAEEEKEELVSGRNRINPS